MFVYWLLNVYSISGLHRINLSVDALSPRAQDFGRQTWGKHRDKTACLELVIAAHLGNWLPPVPSRHWLALQDGELSMSSTAEMVLCQPSTLLPTIQAQWTHMIVHSLSFKITVCQKSEAVTETSGACPQYQQLPIYWPFVRGMNGFIMLPKCRASTSVASYHR